jgi:hypothetical protein
MRLYKDPTTTSGSRSIRPASHFLDEISCYTLGSRCHVDAEMSKGDFVPGQVKQRVPDRQIKGIHGNQESSCGGSLREGCYGQEAERLSKSPVHGQDVREPLGLGTNRFDSHVHRMSAAADHW